MVIAVIDYGVGNLGSICNMLKKAGAKAEICASEQGVRDADKLILPGVGAFDSTVRQLRASGLLEALQDRVLGEKVPLLGICVGMQMLCEGSEEGVEPGLGWIRGRCVRFRPGDSDLRVPHMGWNYVERAKDSPLTTGVTPEVRFYFVHSYHMACEDAGDALLTTDYGGTFTAAVQHGNLYGVQFHPEKSHHFGMDLLRRFAEL
jgi:glutamine amidotransferase